MEGFIFLGAVIVLWILAYLISKFIQQFKINKRLAKNFGYLKYVINLQHPHSSSNIDDYYSIINQANDSLHLADLGDEFSFSDEEYDFVHVVLTRYAVDVSTSYFNNNFDPSFKRSPDNTDMDMFFYQLYGYLDTLVRLHEINERYPIKCGFDRYEEDEIYKNEIYRLTSIGVTIKKLQLASWLYCDQCPRIDNPPDDYDRGLVERLKKDIINKETVKIGYAPDPRYN